MSHDIVHTIGSTVYFVFFLLFLWVSRIPRANPGAGWWALAMLAALASRLAIVALLGEHGIGTAVAAYWALNVVEKFCLLAGLARFFGVPWRLRWLALPLLAVELWILGSVWLDAPSLVRSSGVALFNGLFLAAAAWIAWTRRAQLDPRLMAMVAATSALLALHWSSAFAIIDYYPPWLRYGFMLGMALVLAQYFCLLAAVLLSFQKRLVEAESKALDMAFQDPLTGLSNQRYMSALFEKALILATRPHQLVAVVYIDIDNFKPINDRAGHRVGDEVLKTVAARLRNATRSTDICARIGGDEFVAICTQLEDAEHAHGIARKLLAEFTRPMEIEGRQYVLGASIGISLYPLHGDSLPTLLEYADLAMYEVKKGRKNGYRIHQPDAAATTAPYGAV
ncbi:GGDEF domain-containing protein [Pseudoxanthomonas sp.]|uniref:GGDEF domain-containing protein n=1 Tax=Pseudoxanthomonas sp. TaxID=1871049 RepID=UPI00258CC878|nr:GGDEF domain-containing protein [Pseudoxanthomonas sp.]MCR6685946.1 GGDEF domain-containing protein [Pseudoxanthomonas sp.]